MAGNILFIRHGRALDACRRGRELHEAKAELKRSESYVNELHDAIGQWQSVAVGEGSHGFVWILDLS